MRIAGSASERGEQQRQAKRIYVEKCVAATQKNGAQRMGRRGAHIFEIRSQNGICNIVIAIRDYSFCLIDARTTHSSAPPSTARQSNGNGRARVELDRASVERK